MSKGSERQRERLRNEEWHKTLSNQKNRLQPTCLCDTLQCYFWQIIQTLQGPNTSYLKDITVGVS